MNSNVTNVWVDPRGATLVTLNDFLDGWLLICIAIFGLVGNILSGIILVKPSLRKSPMNFLLFVLTVWDFVLICSILLNNKIIKQSVASMLSGPEACYYYHSFYAIFLTPLRAHGRLGTALLTLLVTFERYVAVCWPLKSRIVCSMKNTIWAGVGTTLFIFAYSLPKWFESEIYMQNIEDNENSTECKYKARFRDFVWNETYQAVYWQWLTFTIQYGLPFVLLAGMNFFIIRGISKFNKNRKNLTSSECREVSLNKMLVCITTLSLICVSERLVATLINTAKLWGFINSNGLFILFQVNLYAVINSSVNFIFYSLYGKKFRQQFKNTFCPRFLKGKNGNVVSSTASKSATSPNVSTTI